MIKERFWKTERFQKVQMCLLGVFLLLVLAAEITTAALSPAPLPLPSEPSAVTEPPVTDPTQPSRPRPELEVSSPAASQEEVLSALYRMTGTADPRFPVYINSIPVFPDSDGFFSFEYVLKPGVNSITVSHKEKTAAYEIRYRYILLTQITPGQDLSLPSGGSVAVTAMARQGSTVTATFRGKTITLEAGKPLDPVPDGSGGLLAEYSGSFKLPSGNVTDLDLGSVSVSATCRGITETMESGRIRCKHTDAVKYSDPSVTPAEGDYTDVGSGYVAEIIYPSAELFDIGNTKDQSSPLLHYLPAGTVDYCYPEVYTDSKTGYQFLKLRCGRKIFLQRHDTPNSGDFYLAARRIEKLPDHNELRVVSMVNNGRHTVLTLDPLWKAPFLFTLAPQKYTNPGSRDWTVSSVTAAYIDIKFCYATVFEGDIPLEDNPLFSRSEILRGKADTTLRLYLRTTGGFYGWDAAYNEQGQLCFTFLNPAQVSQADNPYGTDLSGVRILLDVGHGGYDCGSKGVDPSVTEAERNLNLANLLKAELESMGATVIMNRTTDRLLSSDTRIHHLAQAAPDLCIAIHHNASSDSGVHGCGTYHFNAFSSPAAKAIFSRITASGLYRKTYLNWHYYYLARQTVCPVVLTENGYITNPQDFAAIADAEANLRKAQAIAQGVADYFRSIP